MDARNDTRFGQTLSGALLAMGSEEQYASFSSEWLRPGTKPELYIAADIGLIRAFGRWDYDREDLSSEGHVEIRFEVCPWVDVINPEMSVRAVAIPEGPPSVEVHLLIQIPRVDLTAAGSPAEESASYRLGHFAAEVMRRKSHWHEPPLGTVEFG